MSKQTEALKLALAWVADTAKYMKYMPNTHDRKGMALYAILKEALAEQPAPPPECQTEAEKTAFAFGWFKALETVREQPAQQQEPVAWQAEGYVAVCEVLEQMGIGVLSRAPSKLQIEEMCNAIRTLDTPQPAQRKPLTADELKEPKNGEQWRVVWWNESCRMMLPSDAKLDGFNSYKNGTLQFTIKKSTHGIKE